MYFKPGNDEHHVSTFDFCILLWKKETITSNKLRWSVSYYFNKYIICYKQNGNDFQRVDRICAGK